MLFCEKLLTMALISNPHRKIKGDADIVFLLDVTSSMRSCIGDISECVAHFFEMLQNGEIEPEISWNCRAAVYGYRDFTADGEDNWIVANPFTRSHEEVCAQLSSLAAEGGGNESHDLLDALNALAEIGESQRGESEDDWKWRYRTQARRSVVVFTNASFHGCNDNGTKFVGTLPSYPGKTGDDVIPAILQNKLCVIIYAPDFSGFGWNGYMLLDNTIDKLEYVAITIGSDNNPQQAFSHFVHDKALLMKELVHNAKSFCRACGLQMEDGTDILDDAEFV